MSIPQYFIDEVLARTDIVELISSRIQLKRSGKNAQALCPFHQEKSASFSVNPQKQFYYCFGCGASGNAISFVMAYDHLEFLPALKYLAENVGLELPESENATQQNYYAALYQLNQQVKDFYQKQLKTTPQAIEYLKSRGLSGEICRDFQIGFAPEHFDHLNALAKDATQVKNLIENGLLIRRNNNETYARFRHRIMFPIFDNQGRVVAFGGRSLGDAKPKYLNSPETPIFHKSHELYGLYQAKRSKVDLKELIIVEGYLDVVSLHQFGIKNAVASLGTAINANHIQRLLRHCETMIFCFDGDSAGKKAAWRALQAILPLMRDGLVVKFMHLPNDLDPDDFIRKLGAEAFLKLAASAPQLADYLFEELKTNIDLNSAEGKARYAKQALDLIQNLPNGVYKELLRNALANQLGIDPQQLFAANPPPVKTKTPQKNPAATQTPRLHPLVEAALTLLLQNPQFGQLLANDETIREADLEGCQILFKLLEICAEHPHFNSGALIEYWRDSPFFKQIASLASKDLLLSANEQQQEFQDICAKIIDIYQQKEINQLLTLAKQQGLSNEQKQRLQKILSAQKK